MVSGKHKQEFNDILRTSLKVAGAEEGGLVIRDALTGELRIEEFVGEGVSRRCRIIMPNDAESMCARAVVSRQIEYSPDRRTDGVSFKKLTDTLILSALAIPITYHGQVIGVVNFESPRVDAFPTCLQEDIQQHVAAVEHRLHTAIVEQNCVFLEAHLSALGEVSNAILVTDGNEHEILELILRKALDLAEADTGGILTFNPDRTHLIVRAAWNIAPDGPKSLPRGQGFCWECVNKNKTLNIWNVEEYPTIYHHLSTTPTRSELVCPLYVGGRILGVLNIESTNYNAFGFHHERVVNAFALQASVLLRITSMKRQWSSAAALSRMGDMADNLAHRMQNSIGGAGALAQKVRQRIVDPALQGYMDLIVSNTQDALKILDDHRSKKLRRDQTTIDICAVFRDVLVHAEFPKAVAIDCDLPREALRIIASPAQLEEMLRELIRNSVKYMNGVGHIRISAKRNWDVIVIEIADTGPGFHDLDHPEHVMDLGSRSSMNQIGSGYGLWWIREFVQSLGGTVNISNAERGGAVIKIAVPIEATASGGT